MPKTLVGRVTSDVQDKTIVVTVTRRKTHPLYGKQYTVSKKFAVHDADSKAHVGDLVRIAETRPISKTKSWQLSDILEAGHAAIELREEAEAVSRKEKAKAKEE